MHTQINLKIRLSRPTTNTLQKKFETEFVYKCVHLQTERATQIGLNCFNGDNIVVREGDKNSLMSVVNHSLKSLSKSDRENQS